MSPENAIALLFIGYSKQVVSKPELKHPTAIEHQLNAKRISRDDFLKLNGVTPNSSFYIHANSLLNSADNAFKENGLEGSKKAILKSLQALGMEAFHLKACALYKNYLEMVDPFNQGKQILAANSKKQEPKPKVKEQPTFETTSNGLFPSTGFSFQTLSQKTKGDAQDNPYASPYRNNMTITSNGLVRFNQ